MRDRIDIKIRPDILIYECETIRRNMFFPYRISMPLIELYNSFEAEMQRYEYQVNLETNYTKYCFWLMYTLSHGIIDWRKIHIYDILDSFFPQNLSDKTKPIVKRCLLAMERIPTIRRGIPDFDRVFRDIYQSRELHNIEEEEFEIVDERIFTIKHLKAIDYEVGAFLGMFEAFEEAQLENLTDFEKRLVTREGAIKEFLNNEFGPTHVMRQNLLYHDNLGIILDLEHLSMIANYENVFSPEVALLIKINKELM